MPLVASALTVMAAVVHRDSKLGDAGSDLWKDPEVVAVNHFRNAMVGEASNVSNCGDDNCLMVEALCRFRSSGRHDGGQRQRFRQEPCGY